MCRFIGKQLYYEWHTTHKKWGEYIQILIVTGFAAIIYRLSY